MADKKGRLTTRRTKNNLYLYLDDVLIAKRGQPNTPEEGTWICEPGYEVSFEDDDEDLESIIVTRLGIQIH